MGKTDNGFSFSESIDGDLCSIFFSGRWLGFYVGTTWVFVVEQWVIYGRRLGVLEERGDGRID